MLLSLGFFLASGGGVNDSSYSHQVRGISTEKMFPSDWSMTDVRGLIPLEDLQVVLGSIRKQAEQTNHGEQASSIAPWSLIPALTSLNDGF